MSFLNILNSPDILTSNAYCLIATSYVVFSSFGESLVTNIYLKFERPSNVKPVC